MKQNKPFLSFFLILLICLSNIFFILNLKPITKVQATEIYDGEVKNIFIHSLIAYPEILDTKSKYIIKKYDIDCIDYIEFNNMLNELYKNDYVLIDINNTFNVNENGIAIKNKIKVPKGKKPLVLGIDDVVYDPSKSGNGMVDKICVDKKGNLYTETIIDNKKEISYNREFAPILENFVKVHPDFSYNSAKCCINLTGFCGILGYRISDKNDSFRNKEINDCKKVVNRLKELGYTFACHSYSHYHIKKTCVENVKQDLQDWKDYIEPVIGKTNIFVYPYGEWEIINGDKLSQKQQALCDYGFKLFLGVGIYDFFTQMPLNSNMKQKILFADRKNIDGYTLFNRQEELKKMFDPIKVLSKYSIERHKLK